MNNPIQTLPSVILASRSPRRRQLLDWAEIRYSVITRSTDETIDPVLPVEEVPIAIARTKALAVQENVENIGANESYNSGLEHTPILAADTIVVLEGEILGKPENRKEAIHMLTKLSGKTHKVITGVVILCGDIEMAFSDTTEVTFYDLTENQIAGYVNKYDPYDKAGAYAIQEWIGVVGIERISGDFYNVMGLPVARVVHALQQLCETPG